MTPLQPDITAAFHDSIAFDHLTAVSEDKTAATFLQTSWTQMLHLTVAMEQNIYKLMKTGIFVIMAKVFGSPAVAIDVKRQTLCVYWSSTKEISAITQMTTISNRKLLYT